MKIRSGSKKSLSTSLADFSLKALGFLLVAFFLPPTESFTVGPSNRGGPLPPRSCSTSLDMMKGSVFCAVTIDGFIATTDGDVSFLNDYGDPSAPPDPEDPYSFENFLSKVDVMIMGRKTFEKVLSFGRENWPYGKLRILVWTKQADYIIPDHLHESVSCTDLSPTALWDDLQNQGYEHAYIDGGATIAAFAAFDLIEDWILTRVPLILGEGIPLFAPPSSNPKARWLRLSHVHTKCLPGGLVTSHYRSTREPETRKETNDE